MAPRRIIATLCVLLFVICAGIATGVFLRHIDSQGTVLEQSPPLRANDASGREISQNKNTYTVSPPHRGYAHKSTLLEVTAQTAGQVTARAQIDETQAGEIQKDQPAYLYNKDAQLLALPAKVEGIRFIDEEGKRVPLIDITMAELPDLAPEKIVAVEIITDTFADTNRLPIGALQTDKNGKAFLWEATRQQNGQTVAMRRNLPFAALADRDVLAFENSNYISNIYILNPDTDLKDGQNIITLEKTYDAPQFLKPARLVNAYMEKLNQYRQMKLEPDLTDASDFSTSCGTSCGETVPANDFIERVKALAEKQAAQQQIE